MVIPHALPWGLHRSGLAAIAEDGATLWTKLSRVDAVLASDNTLVHLFCGGRMEVVVRRVRVG